MNIRTTKRRKAEIQTKEQHEGHHRRYEGGLDEERGQCDGVHDTLSVVP